MSQDEPRLDEPTVNLTMEALTERLARVQGLTPQVPLPRPEAFMEQNIPEADLRALAVFVQATEPAVLCLALKHLGDSARIVTNRNVLSALNLFATLSALLDPSVSKGDEVIRNALRLLANLCFDNPYAREKILEESKLLPRLVAQFSRASSEGLTELQRVCAGAIANIASTNEEIGEALQREGALALLVPLLFQNDDDNVRAMTARALRNLCEPESNRAYLINNKVVDFALKLVADIEDDDNMVGELVGLVQAISATKTALNDMVLKQGLLGALLKALRHLEDVPTIADVAEFLQSLAENDSFRDEFLHQGHLASIRALFLDTSLESATRLSAGRLYAALSSSDAIMPQIYSEMELFVSLLLKDPSKEMQQIAALTLGNLARSDEKVGEMMDRGVAEALVEVVKNPERDLSVRHYSLSCLRNIALLDRNKMRLFKMDLLPAALKLLGERMSPVLVHSDLSLLKNLLLGGEPIVRSAIELGLLEDLQSLVDFDEADHVKFEACRLVAQLCKDSFTHDRIVSSGLVAALSTLVAARWDVLVLEGSLALKLISDNNALNRELVGLLPHLLSTLRGVLFRKPEPKADILPETKVIVIKALESLCQSDKVAKRFYNLKLHEGLKELDLKSKDDLITKILNRVESVKGLAIPEVDSLPATEAEVINPKKIGDEETDADEYSPKVEPADHDEKA